MIRVTVELFQYGSPLRGRVIGEIDLINDGTGTALHGNYNVRLRREDNIGDLSEAAGEWYTVINHYRDDGWPELLRRALVEEEAVSRVRP